MKMVVTIIGAGMMGSALAFPAAENGHEVRLVGSPLDDDIIDVEQISTKNIVYHIHCHLRIYTL